MWFQYGSGSSESMQSSSSKSIGGLKFPVQSPDSKAAKLFDEKSATNSSSLIEKSEDLVAMWNEKENGFANCMQVSEEEMTKLKFENSKLIESLRGSKEEASKLRDILKQALSEATVVKKDLEIARNENSLLKDLLPMERKNQFFPSLSNVSDSRVPSSMYTEDGETLSPIDFDHIARNQSNGMDYANGSPMRQKKKQPVMKRFGEMLRGKSFHK